MLGSSAPIMGLLQEMQLRERTLLLIMWTSQGISWTLESLGNLDSMDLLDLWIFWGSPWILSNRFLDLPWENSGLMISWDS